jgi:hypothetical protein
VIIFGSVRFLSKKVTKLKFFFEKKPKPNRNRVKPTGFGSVQFFRAKTGSNQFGSVFLVLARFFSVCLGFGSVFPVWLSFGSVWLGFFSVFCRFRFGSVFCGLLLIKPKPNRTGRFFQKYNRFNRFFLGSVFSIIFISVFLI